MPEFPANGLSHSGRPFPWFCPRCRKKEVRPVTIPYHAERLYDGQLVTVDIPHLKVPKCADCGELVFNYAAEEQILDAVKSQAGVPHPAS